MSQKPWEEGTLIAAGGWWLQKCSRTHGHLGRTWAIPILHGNLDQVVSEVFCYTPSCEYKYDSLSSFHFVLDVSIIGG